MDNIGTPPGWKNDDGILIVGFSLTIYSLMCPCALSGGLQEHRTVPSSALSQLNWRLCGGSGTATQTEWPEMKREKKKNKSYLRLMETYILLECAEWDIHWSCAVCWGTESEPSRCMWCLASTQSERHCPYCCLCLWTSTAEHPPACRIQTASCNWPLWSWDNFVIQLWNYKLYFKCYILYYKYYKNKMFCFLLAYLHFIYNNCFI